MTTLRNPTDAQLENALVPVPIPGTKHNFVTPDGRIWTNYLGVFRERKCSIHYGYRLTKICVNNRNRTIRVCQIIAAIFLPKPSGIDTEVCHRNDIKHDDRVENLYWGTHAENMKDCYRNGCRLPTRKLSDEQVSMIKAKSQAGKRNCELARMFAVSDSHISDILKGKKRAHGVEVAFEA